MRDIPLRHNYFPSDFCNGRLANCLVVGKSTLINKTFGVDVTQSSHRTRGIHDVREEITWEGRPDLIVHDSGGFEAGADDEFQAIEAFLKEKSEAEDLLARVHVIWYDFKTLSLHWNYDDEYF